MTATDFIKKLENINQAFHPIAHNKKLNINDHFNQFLFLFEKEFSNDNSIGCILPVFFELTSWANWTISNYNYLKCLTSVTNDKLNKILTYQTKLANKLEKHFSRTVVEDRNSSRKNILIQLNNSNQDLEITSINDLVKFNFPIQIHQDIIKKYNLDYKTSSTLNQIELKTIDGIDGDEIKNIQKQLEKIIVKDESFTNGFFKEIIKPVITHSLYLSKDYSLLYIFSHTVSRIKDYNKSIEYDGGLGGIFLLLNNELINNDSNLVQIVKLVENISDKLSIRIINYYQLREIYKQQLKTAIISILIDSYAHNISAHSLSALKWWIELRNKMLDKRIKVDANDIKIVGLLPEINISGRKPQKDKKDSIKYDDKGNILFEKDDPLYKTTQMYNEALGLTDSIYNASYYSLFDFLQFADENIVKDLFKFTTQVDQKETNSKFHPRFPVPIDYALYSFFRFLRDKGAFWSGVTRDMAFGGESKTWYKILWEDFANNPLYLGTIAKSEGITKININLDVDIGKKHHKGRFVTIDMSVIDYEEKLSQDPNLDARKYSELLKSDVNLGDCSECKNFVGQDNYSKYAFIKMGKCFAKFREILENEENCRVFLPGGIVGEHALFTIFENTIRNIKHYKDETTLKDIQKNGIDFWISIKEDKLWVTKQNDNSNKSESANLPSANQNKESKPAELFKVGVWLEHEAELVRVQKVKEKDENGKEIEKDVNKYLLFDITENTLKKILDEETGAPRMGGNSQDKACAAMLFNNKFSSVERTETERDKKYFPWIEFATKCNNEEYILDIKYDTTDEIIAQFKSDYNSKFLCNGKKGILKKYFYLWRSENVFVVSAKEDFDSENVSRFKFVLVNESNSNEGKLLINRAREAGIIRILSRKRQNNKTVLSLRSKKIRQDFLINELYVKWFKEWFINSEIFFKFCKGKNSLSIVYYKDQQKFGYKSAAEKDYDKFRNSFLKNLLQIQFSHGGNDEETACNVRSHGAFWSKFFSNTDEKEPIYLYRNKDGKPFRISKENKYLIPELLEILATRVIIFDNRVYKRFVNLSKKKLRVFNKSLNLYVFEESLGNDRTISKILDKINSKPIVNNLPTFLIVHLSFIESLNYSELQLHQFIKEHISKYIKKNNFVLVITSGRGRESWRESLKNVTDKKIDLKSKVIFKPVEALLNAVETGISYNDNFDVKYNLIKVLFGS